MSDELELFCLTLLPHLKNVNGVNKNTLFRKLLRLANKYYTNGDLRERESNKENCPIVDLDNEEDTIPQVKVKQEQMATPMINAQMVPNATPIYFFASPQPTTMNHLPRTSYQPVTSSSAMPISAHSSLLFSQSGESATSVPSPSSIPLTQSVLSSNALPRHDRDLNVQTVHKNIAKFDNMRSQSVAPYMLKSQIPPIPARNPSTTRSLGTVNADKCNATKRPYSTASASSRPIESTIQVMHQCNATKRPYSTASASSRPIESTIQVMHQFNATKRPYSTASASSRPIESAIQVMHQLPHANDSVNSYQVIAPGSGPITAVTSAAPNPVVYQALGSNNLQYVYYTQAPHGL